MVDIELTLLFIFIRIFINYPSNLLFNNTIIQTILQAIILNFLYQNNLLKLVFGNTILKVVPFLYSESILIFKPNLSHIFLAKYKPIPVDLVLLLSLPVKPFSKTFPISLSLIPLILDIKRSNQLS